MRFFFQALQQLTSAWNFWFFSPEPSIQIFTLLQILYVPAMYFEPLQFNHRSKILNSIP